MSRRPPRKRELSEEERRLWEQAMRETTALRNREGGAGIPGPAGHAAPAQQPREASEAPRQPEKNAGRQRAPAASPRPPSREGGEPRVTPLARREARRLVRDPESIDARLDLHGMRQREAYPALKGFLRASQARGHRMVLVITGKGGARETTRENYEAWEAAPFYESQRGVLRRLVPEWLAKPEFRDVVAGISPAHQRHGGEGALYVRLRKIAPQTAPASRPRQ